MDRKLLRHLYIDADYMNQELKFVYGLDDSQVRQIVLGDGNLACNRNTLTCNSGSSPGAMSAIQGISPIFFTHDSIEVSFTAIFGTPTAGTLSVIGIGDNEAGCMLGYNNGQLGVAVSIAGNMQYYYINLTGGAVMSDTLSISVNNTTANVQCSSGDSIAVIQQNIVAAVAQIGYLCYTCGTGVWIMSLQAQPSSAPPSINVNTTGIQATIALLSEGVTPTTTWVYAGDWNGLSASNIVDSINWPSGNMLSVELDPLGYGTINYYIIEPQSGDKTLLHSFNQRNTNDAFTLPSGLWPAMYCQNFGGIATSIGTTGFMIKGTNYCEILKNRPIRTTSCHYEAIALTNTDINLITLASNLLVTYFSGGQNTSMMRNRRTVLVKTLYLSIDCQAPCIISIYKNATLSHPLQFTATDSKSCVLVNQDTSATVTGSPSRSYYTIAVPTTIELTLNGVFLAPLNTLSVTCKTVGKQLSANIGVQVSWSEM